MDYHKKKIKCELYNDNFQSWKQYPIHKAQLVIADIPYKNYITYFLTASVSVSLYDWIML